MSEQDGTRSRKWWRFSLRSLLAVTALVCIYFGSWQATQSLGVTAVLRLQPEEGEVISAASAPMPLVVRRYHIYDGPGFTSYYLWLLGPVVRLPYEEDWEEAPYPSSNDPPPSDDPFGE